MVVQDSKLLCLTSGKYINAFVFEWTTLTSHCVATLSRPDEWHGVQQYQHSIHHLNIRGGGNNPSIRAEPDCVRKCHVTLIQTLETVWADVSVHQQLNIPRCDVHQLTAVLCSDACRKCRDPTASQPSRATCLSYELPTTAKLTVCSQSSVHSH